MGKLKYMLPEVDTHTHTILSGHAWGTLHENVQAAKEKGLRGICLTEHGPAIPGGVAEFTPSAQVLLPEVIKGIRVYRGVELSIMDASGKTDIPDRLLEPLDFVIASCHLLAADFSGKEEITQGYLGALENPCIDMLGHFHDIKTPSDIYRVVEACAVQKKLMEINGSYMIESRKNCRPYLKECLRIIMEKRVRVCVSSDAHYPDQVGGVSEMMELLDSIGFPEEQIVNLTIGRFEKYLEERTERIRKSRLI